MKNPATAPPNYPIESVDNALRLVVLFRDQRSIRVSEASRHLGVARSTAHRLLAMLQYHGFTRQDPVTRAHLPGPVLVEIGLSVVREMDVRRLLEPTVRALRDRLDETVHAAVLQGRDVLFIDGAESSQPLRAANRTGTVLPAHSTACGKVLLAHLPAPEVRDLLPARLPALTGATIVSRAHLQRELEVVRDSGVAVNLGESEPNLTAVAAAVVDSSGRARAALTVTAPSVRATQEWIEGAREAVREAATEVSRLLD